MIAKFPASRNSPHKSALRSPKKAPRRAHGPSRGATLISTKLQILSAIIAVLPNVSFFIVRYGIGVGCTLLNCLGFKQRLCR